MTTTSLTATYRVDVTEILTRSYLVTTSGGESRARELAERGDSGLPADEVVELLEDFDNVVDTKINGVYVEA